MGRVLTNHLAMSVADIEWFKPWNMRQLQSVPVPLKPSVTKVRHGRDWSMLFVNRSVMLD